VGERDEIPPVDIDPTIVGLAAPFDLVSQLFGVERREIAKALRIAQGNKTRASEMLGISRFTLQRKLEKYDVTE
jgi:DNA-binding protein Fis